MAAIISLKTQHDAAGQPVQIQYRDHNVDHGRIERAFKRRKGPMSAPTCKIAEHANGEN